MPEDMVYKSMGKDYGNNDWLNNKNNKLLSMHRFSMYEDTGGVGGYSTYTPYKFYFGKAGESECKTKDVEFNVSSNLGSCAVITARHAKRDYKDGEVVMEKLGHLDRCFNQWMMVKLSEMHEYVQVDLGGGTLAVLCCFNERSATRLIDFVVVDGRC